MSVGSGLSAAAAIDDSGQFKDVAGCAPTPVASGSVFRIGTDFSRFRHQKVEITLWEFVEILQFQLPSQQVTAEPLAQLFLRGDLIGHPIPSR